MDTRNYVGLKSTVLYVSLLTASGREAEVGLGVTSHILSDIVLNPGSIDFGTVARGQTPSHVMTIDRINGADWRFTRMVSACKAINAQLVETKRDGTAVSYSLSVSLKPDAPSGRIRDEIRIISNDPETPSIPVLVTAWVRGELTAAPSVLTLGQIHSSAGARPICRARVASVCDPSDRRHRRRFFGLAARWKTPGYTCRGSRLQARRGDDAG